MTDLARRRGLAASGNLGFFFAAAQTITPAPAGTDSCRRTEANRMRKAALWAGVPVLTCRGQTFAGRVGASILLEAGLPDLITNSLEEYRARLLQLVAEPAALRDYHTYLERTREENPLFDTVGFTRDWEALLLRVYKEAAAS